MAVTSEQVKIMWEKFVFHNELDPDLPPMIRDSWLRSKKAMVDPFRPYGWIKEIDNEKYRSLIDWSLPLMEGLYSIVKGSGFLVILCNENGQLLLSIGDREPLARAEEIGFIAGADWSEQVMGTNAIGTSIAIDRPIQVFAEEHYTKICQSWTCSAAPIHDPDGRIIGVLNMSGPYEKVHSHTLGMVVSAVKAIEYQLKLHENAEKNVMMQRFLEATTNNMKEGILIIDRDGKIVKANNQLKKLFRIPQLQLEEKKLDDLFNDPSICSNHPLHLQNQELHLSVKPSNAVHHVLVDKIPIYEKKERIGSMIIVKEIEKVRQFVNHLSGNQAKITFADMIGQHPCFIEKMNEARLAAATDSNVLILGESGTGKEMVAQAIHNESKRRNKPFIAINCGGIPRDLLGSELFGYVDGAFTGAKKGGSAGKFELANGGTLFLDEIGEMSLEMQVLLLRVIQEKEVMRIGGHKVIPVDVRIIAATNKDLRREVQKGSFREDLFFRLNVMPIVLPPLRERKEDIPLLVRHFIERLAHKRDKPFPEIRSDFLEALMQYDWPGNIRELQNIIERVLNQCTKPMLTAADLPEEIFQPSCSSQVRENVDISRNEIKKQSIIEALKQCNGNISKAARYLGISRSTFYRQMDKWNIRY
ncbi:MULTISPECIES: sigma-54-dependent Fis family transcriptional regulator [Geobacillus]|uniref:Sigma-54-dependent Fis family transcriptional regulator n=1 Tax=Geobacillus zalihae TaxID=213419 RepID=A0A7H1RUS5_9BACL|nr:MULTISPECIES: sigma-54-dependent Fis family transcriptional regulator [Geobacillus]KLR75418.1 diguanylate cyclase [Geobacillus sp. T6]OQP24468.1 sigma-54-dependent Fis family transcriptional regulator [Geobacillus zalihae]QNU18014.1 sigma-54-dependent Fis family transcriptional regulator [Geobacillus zalihae]